MEAVSIEGGLLVDAQKLFGFFDTGDRIAAVSIGLTVALALFVTTVFFMLIIPARL